MRKRSPFLVLFALLAVAAIVAGCGGGDSSSDTSGSTESTESQSGDSGGAPTKATFIKEADEICTADEEELNAEIKAFAKEKGIDVSGEEEPSTEQQEELFQELVLPNIAEQGEEIAALTPPAGDEATVEELTDTVAEEVSEAEDKGGLPDNDTLKGATEQAQAYGLESCGS